MRYGDRAFWTPVALGALVTAAIVAALQPGVLWILETILAAYSVGAVEAFRSRCVERLRAENEVLREQLAACRDDAPSATVKPFGAYAPRNLN